MKRFFSKLLEILLWVLVITTLARTLVIYNNLNTLRLEIKSIEMEVLKEKELISKLEIGIERAKTEEGLEKIIRETLRFIKPGESIIILDKP